MTAPLEDQIERVLLAANALRDRLATSEGATDCAAQQAPDTTAKHIPGRTDEVDLMLDRFGSLAGPDVVIPPDQPSAQPPREEAVLPALMPAGNPVAWSRSWRRWVIAGFCTAAVLAGALWTGGSLLRPAVERPPPPVSLASMEQPASVPEPEKIPQRLNDSAVPAPPPRAETTSPPVKIGEQSTARAAGPPGTSPVHDTLPPDRAEAGGGNEYNGDPAGRAATLATAGQFVERRLAQELPSGPSSHVASPRADAAPETNAAALQDVNAYPSPGATAPRAPQNGSAACLAARPSALQLPPDEIARLVEGGQAFMRQARVSAARLMFQRAAQACDWRAAFALATTYDPVMLRKLGTTLATPDVATARAWYEKAKQLGSTEASQYLERLSRQGR